MGACEEGSGEGSGIVYTGYEWRSRTTVGDQVLLQVLALSEDGNTMTVVMLSNPYDFPETSHQRFSGELLLEVVG